MRSKNNFKSIVFAIFTAIFVLSCFSFAFGQTTADPELERQELEAELKKLEEQIAKYEKDITVTQQQKKTLQNQISLLKKKIEKLNLQIQQSNIMIKDLGLQIADTEKSINKTSLKIEDSKEKLAGTLRLIYEEDQRSLAEIFLAEDRLSDFFDNLVSLEALSARSQELLKDIKSLKVDLETQKQSLDGEKDELERMTQIQTLQKQESESTKKDQERILGVTKGKESEYQKMLQDTKKLAAETRARIFELIGVPEAPTFGEAVDLAKYVENITGIRPAFLLAVLRQESNIGKNVGQCYLKNTETGVGTVARTGVAISRVMKPGRDIENFLTITKELLRDPYRTLVSCPMSYGWGGAMGPAQFIPATWMLYRERVKAITGSADPWKIKDAFVAAALYLKDKGAGSQKYNDEWRAAIAYFAGSVNLNYRFYGDSVMSIAKGYEEDIKAIEKANGNH
ncbi:MAG: hypothetical protein COT34_00080 [Candidatus Nealsonbacteria bacterium CG08_land_8_20_14_0_20_43_11]|uniref:Transglycosylase SLT domain-containing protein n=1 Tax=Candidatus Nealsonbacteria bacterium CG08_land_8_20_14_0_20_43_11 TaxID=1974706 RepID=A0A2M6T1D2_9BACT|nr:MAG: hypothetical protein COT34_00080 [Candidatus Nealsonbacteria bacterium CG08_land_8_20_14_0_20_43_11]